MTYSVFTVRIRSQGLNSNNGSHMMNECKRYVIFYVLTFRIHFLKTFSLFILLKGVVGDIALKQPVSAMRKPSGLRAALPCYV